MTAIHAALGRLRSLQLRFMVIVALSALLFSAVAGGLAYRFGRESALADNRKTLEGLAGAVEKTVAIGAYAGDRVLLQEVVDGLARNGLVAAVEVQDARGARLVGSPHEQPASVESPASTMEIERVLASPFDPAEHIGKLRIQADEGRLEAAAHRAAYDLGFLMAGQAALVALLLYATAAWLVSRPIVDLARRLGQIQPGTDERLRTPPLHRHDEIGVLITGANALLEANAAVLGRERELRTEVESMEAQYRQMFESSSAGIFVLDGRGRLINGNPTVSKVVGLTLDEMRMLRQEDFVECVFGDPGQLRLMIERAGRLGETVSADLELAQRGNTRRWVHCLISVQQGAGADAGDTAPMVEGVIYDITDRKRAEQAVRHRSERDALTGLHNRASSDARVDGLIAEAMAGGGRLSLLCIDLDGFKQVNDSHGHHVGDQTLVACAERMQAAVRRSSDVVARVGGDEFVVALHGVGPDDPLLTQTAQALLDALTEPVVLGDDTQIRVGASIGMSSLPRHGDSRMALLQAADAAMYAVKRTGKHSYAMAYTVCQHGSTDSPPAQQEPGSIGMPGLMQADGALHQSGDVAPAREVLLTE